MPYHSTVNRAKNKEEVGMAGANLVLNQKSSMPSQMCEHVAMQDAAIHIGSSEYYSLQRSIFDAAFPFVTPRCKIVDLSCSNGDWLAPFVDRFEDLCHFIAVDDDERKTYSCMDRFRMRVRLGFFEICQIDLAERFPETSSRVTISVLGIGCPPEDAPLPGTRRRFRLGGAGLQLVGPGALGAVAQGCGLQNGPKALEQGRGRGLGSVEMKDAGHGHSASPHIIFEEVHCWTISIGITTNLA